MSQEENEVKQNPYLTTSELGIPVFNKDTSKSLREMFNEDKIMITSDEIEFSKHIKELNEEYDKYILVCSKTNCGSNFCGKCTLESPNRNFDNCNDFYTVE